MAGKKLLVADDSLTIQKVIRLALSNEGYEIQAVSDGNDAIQQISVFRPDAVLIDVSLPGKSAFEVKKAVNDQADLAYVRFVLMSSAFERVDEAKAKEVHFHGRLTKPFDPAHLRQVLSTVLADAPTHSEPSAFRAPEPESPALSIPPEPSFGEFQSEDFLSPIAPVPAPPVSPTIELTTEPPTAENELPAWEPDLPPPPLPSGQGDSDIKQLTESTIKMSGLDDFQWSVNENAKKDEGIERRPEPELPPHPNMFDIGLDLPPPPPLQTQSHAEEQGYVPLTAPTPLNPPELTAGIEEVIRRQVEQTLQQMAQRILPEVAEKVIKQEIHRMLQEQF